MATRIQVRRDLAANWTGSLVLASGEIAYETDTGNVKIGDNITPWSSLDYVAIANKSSASTDLSHSSYRTMGRFYLLTTSGSWSNLPTDMTAADGASLLLVTRHMDGANAWFYQQLIQFVTSGSETKEWVRAYSAGSSSWSAWRSTSHLSPDEVVTASINNLAVTTAKIDNLAVTTAKLADTNVTTAKIADNNVTDAKIRDSAALSVIGRSANSTGDPADIAASNDGEVLRRSGTALGFGTLASAAFADNTISPARLTNASGATVLGATGAGAISQLSAVNARTAINGTCVMNGSNLASGAGSSNPGDYCIITATASFTLPVGGTWMVICGQRVGSNATFDGLTVVGAYAGGSVLSVTATPTRTLTGLAWRMI